MCLKIRGVVVFTVGLLAIGCGSHDKEIEGQANAAKADADAEKHPDEDFGQAANQQADLSERLSGALVDVGYRISITALGITFCDGTIGLKLNLLVAATGNLFEMPNSKLKCILFPEIDISKLVGGLATTKNQPASTSEVPVVVEGGVIKLKGFPGILTYSEPKAILPSIFSEERDVLAKIDYEQEVRVETFDGSTGQGSVHLKSLGFGEPYVASKLSYKFEDVYRFTLDHTGFDSVNKLAGGLLFRSMDAAVSLDPPAILHAKVVTPVSDALAVMGISPQTISGFVGGGPIIQLLIGLGAKIIDITVELELVSMQGLGEDPTLSVDWRNASGKSDDASGGGDESGDSSH